MEPGENVGYGESTDANSFLISAAARAAGATVFRVAVHSNDKQELKQAITDQLIRADLVISTTGGRREEYEAVAEAMSELGLVDAVEVAMSPGRTQTFGLIGEERVPMVMLPGNPVSAYVSFQVFVWPLLRRLMGATCVADPYVPSPGRPCARSGAAAPAARRGDRRRAAPHRHPDQRPFCHGRTGSRKRVDRFGRGHRAGASRRGRPLLAPGRILRFFQVSWRVGGVPPVRITSVLFNV